MWQYYQLAYGDANLAMQIMDQLVRLIMSSNEFDLNT